MARTTPLVCNNLLKDGDQQGHVLVESQAWWDWLRAAETAHFRFEGKQGSFTARRERKGGGFYWYAYRKQQGRLHKLYLGRSEELTYEKMEQVARTLVQREQSPAAREPAENEFAPAADWSARTQQSAQAGKEQIEGEFVSASNGTTLPLLTKLYAPKPRGELVARPRLYAVLDQGIRRRLTTISAPAGFGKTTLISSWRATTRASQLPLAWVSLDQGDNDPARFWNYIIAALQRIQPGLAEPLAAVLQAPPTQLPPLEAILISLINAITAIKQDFVLALDDYHLIDTQTIHDSMAFLLDHQPECMRLLLLSRTQPPLPLSKLRARGELCELHTTDLRFTQEEIALFLDSVMGLHLPAPEIALLNERTEGWVAGLQLAALSLQGRQDTAPFLATFNGSHHHILDYLSAEVLARQPDEVRDFLLSTSLLKRLNASLCNAVTQRQDSQEMLGRIERSNLFLVPLDEAHHWYRYHHLFAEFLREQLTQHAPETIPQLQRRAIGWYAEHHLMGEALEHALESSEFVLAAQMLEQIGTAMVKSGEMMTLLNWLTRCPAEIIRKNPHLLALFAGALGSIGQIDAAELRVKEAKEALKELKMAMHSGLAKHEPEYLQLVEGEVGAIRTFLVSARADVQGTIDAAQETLHYLSEDDMFVRSLVSASLGQAYFLAGNMARAREVFRATRIHSEAAHNLHALVVSVTCEGYMLMLQNKSYAADEVLRQALHLTSDSSERLVPAVSLAYTALAVLHYDWDDLDKTLEFARRAVEIGQTWGYMLMLAQAYSVMAQALYAAGHTAQAMALFEEAEQLMQRYNSPKGLSWLQAMRSRLWLMQGNLDSPLAWIQAADLRVDDTLTYLNEYEHMVLARVLLAQGSYEEAEAFLNRLLAQATSEERDQNVTMMLLIKAQVLARKGERELALLALEEALRLGEPAGSLRPFVDEGRPMLELLKFALSRGRFPVYIRRLLAAFPATERAQTLANEEDSLLSEREREVLRLLAVGCSNQQIAQEFVVALSTIKTHLGNIYLKLGVHSRTQAIARAKEWRLL